MKNGFLRILLFVSVLVAGYYVCKLFYNPEDHNLSKFGSRKSVVSDTLRDGDIIFHTSLSSQSMAIQKATKSPYSHCGIIYKNRGEFYVFEAEQSVKLTLLKEWIARGKEGKYVIKRLKNSDKFLSSEVLLNMKKEGEKLRGKEYDFAFKWDDTQIYCSELVWKIYKRGAGLEIGKPEKLKDFDLTDAEVKDKLKERYGEHIPWEETVITPVSLFNSDLLETVKEG